MSKKRTRLTSTKSFFDKSLSSSKTIHTRVVTSIDKNIEAIEQLLEQTRSLEKNGSISALNTKLSRLLKLSNYPLSEITNKKELVSALKKFRGDELIVRRAAAATAIVSIYASFEDFMRQTMLKYYEDDVRRLHSSNKTIKYSELVSLVINDELVLRTLAYDLVDNTIRGSIRTWTDELIKMGFKTLIISDTTREMVLVRNAIIHNGARATKELAQQFPGNYETWKRFDISDDKLDEFFHSTHKTATWIQQEFSRMYRSTYSNWDEPNYGIKPEDQTFESDDSE